MNITELSYLDKLSTDTSSRISGQIRLYFGSSTYECTLGNTGSGDWTVTWVRGSSSGGQDVYTYSCDYV